jgi:hypothetical protein
VASALVGMWDDQTRYRVIDPETGRSEVVSIMGTAEEMCDSVFIKELEHWARETVTKDWKRQDEKAKGFMNPQQRKDMGATMKEIHSSLEHRKESLHGRYW